MPGFVDIHSHILPGMDDGSQSLEESLAIAKEAEKNGINNIIATPHFGGRYGFFEYTALEELADLLNTELKLNDIDVRIHPGAENSCTPDILDWSINGKIIKLANGNHLLIDLPFNEIPIYLPEMIFRLKLLGFSIVLAHVERNTMVQSNPLVLEPLINQGVLVQVNSTSLTGLLGKAAKNSATYLAKKRKIDVIASDSHSISGRLPNFLEAFNILVKLTNEAYARKVMSHTPSLICGII